MPLAAMIVQNPAPMTTPTTIGTAMRNAPSTSVLGPMTRRRTAYALALAVRGLLVRRRTGEGRRRRLGERRLLGLRLGLGGGRLLRRGLFVDRRAGECGGGRHGRARAAFTADRLGRTDDGACDLPDRVLPEAGSREQLLGAVLGAGKDRRCLCARPLERLLDLGAGRIRQLGGLVTGLLEQAAALGLRLLELPRGVGVRLREQLPRLVTRGV